MKESKRVASVYAPYAADDPDYDLRLALYREHDAHIPDYGVAKHDHLREMFDAGLEAERLDSQCYQALILGCLHPDSLTRPTLDQIAEVMGISAAEAYKKAKAAIIDIGSYYGGLEPDQSSFLKQRLDTQALLTGVMEETYYYRLYPSVAKNKVLSLPEPKPSKPSNAPVAPKASVAIQKPKPVTSPPVLKPSPVSHDEFKENTKLRNRFDLPKIIVSERRFLADDGLTQELFEFARRTNTPMQLKIISAGHFRRKDKRMSYESLATHFESYAEDIKGLEQMGLKALWNALNDNGLESLQNFVKGLMPVEASAPVETAVPKADEPKKPSRLRQQMAAKKLAKRARKGPPSKPAVQRILPRAQTPHDWLLYDIFK